MVATMKIQGVCDVMSCSFVGRCQRFGKRWRLQVPLKCWYFSTKPHGVIPQKTTNLRGLITAVITSNLYSWFQLSVT